MTKAILEISGSDNLQYSLNFDGQKFKDKKNLENIQEYSKFPETVELSGYLEKISFTVFNVVLNTTEPAEYGPLYFIISIHKDLWNEEKIIPVIDNLIKEFKIDFGTLNLEDTEQIKWEFDGRWTDNPLEIKNGMTTGIFSMNFLNQSQAESSEIGMLINAFGVSKTLSSGYLLWSLSKSELSAIRKRLKAEGKRMLT
ncbi:MAG: hypothetical protein R2780_09155 [Crocinitomicaceae bacterium]|nr:hypothetical protein [Crocinitomicaceae bacterium]